MTAEPEEDPKKRRSPFRDEVWGDEPQEVDASEVVEELETSRPELARRWHDHPTIVPFKIVAGFIARNGKRVAITIAGFVVLLAGLAMLVLPGPGIVVIIAGLAILATEYVWAQRLLRIAKEKANQAKDAVFRKKQEEGKTEGGGRTIVTGGSILIGTSSWTDPTLIKEGNFYPPGTNTAEGRLKFYASKFPLVEVDSTYYFPPSERNSELWIERTPADFTFNIKAYSLLTNHPTKPESLYGDIRDELPKELLEKRRLYRDKLPEDAVDEVWERFRLALYPLHSAGKLGAVLFQFPQYFTISRKNKAYIEEAVTRLPDYRIAIEFRHKSWLEERNVDETVSFLEERNLPLVCVDMPQGFDSSVPPIAAATADDLAMVRFHGRDPKAWQTKSESASERFRYDYEKNELQEWVPKIEGSVGGDSRDPRADEQLLSGLRGAQREGPGCVARPGSSGVARRLPTWRGAGRSYPSAASRSTSRSPGSSSPPSSSGTSIAG